MTGYPHNAPVAELCTAEMFTVVSLRLWLEARCDRDTDERWRRGFVLAGLDDAAATTFHSLMMYAAMGARHALDIRRHHDPRLGADEARVLDLIGLLQRGCTTQAELALRGWLSFAAARSVLPLAMALAAAMAEQGLKVPQRPDETALCHRFGSDELPQRTGALSLVH
jgi:hypothetical protein